MISPHSTSLTEASALSRLSIHQCVMDDLTDLE